MDYNPLPALLWCSSHSIFGWWGRLHAASAYITFWAFSHSLIQDFPHSSCSLLASALKPSISPRCLSSLRVRIIFRNEDLRATHVYNYWCSTNWGICVRISIYICICFSSNSIYHITTSGPAPQDKCQLLFLSIFVTPSWEIWPPLY